VRSAFPPLDLHAHIDVTAPASQLRGLQGVIFAATRSLAESHAAAQRQDDHIIWGAGSHPGIASSHRSFDADAFRTLIAKTPYVGEAGLDGAAKVPMDTQLQTLRSILGVLADEPRILSLHSYRATDQVLDELSSRPVPGAVLHWWLGSAAATRRAVDLGCYFSVNAAMFRHSAMLRHVPVDRLLAETDHPYGDRTGPEPRQPGNVLPVEHALARLHGLEPEDMRRKLCRNLGQLLRATGSARLVSRRIRSYLIAS